MRRLLFLILLLLAALVLATPALATTPPQLGGLGASNTGADDTIPIGNGTAFVEVAITPCTGVAAAMQYDAAGNTLGCVTIQTGHAIEDEGLAVTDQATLNFTGVAITCTSAGSKITCSVTAIPDLVSDTTPQLGGDLDLNGKSITSSSPILALTPTEMSYLDGVTSAIQAQLNAKASTSHCGTHDSADIDCSGETIVFAAASVDLANLNGCTGSAAGEVVVYNVGSKSCQSFPVPGHTIQDEGTARPARSAINMVGAAVDCVDDLPNDRTVCTFTLGSGHTIQDEGSDMPSQVKLNFTGAGVTCSNDGANGATVCDIPGGGGSGSTLVIQEEGAPLSLRDNLNFIGNLITCVVQDASTVSCTVATPLAADFDVVSGVLSLDPTRAIPALTRPQLADDQTMDGSDKLDGGPGVIQVPRRADCGSEANVGSVCLDNSGAKDNVPSMKTQTGGVVDLITTIDERLCEHVSARIQLGGTNQTNAVCTLHGDCQPNLWFAPSGLNKNATGAYTLVEHDAVIIGPVCDTDNDVVNADTFYCRFQKATANCDVTTTDGALEECWTTSSTTAQCTITGTTAGNERLCNSQKLTRTTVLEGERWLMLANWAKATPAASYAQASWFVCPKGGNLVN